VTPTPDDLGGSAGLITGASGFIGRAIMAALPRGTVVHATYRSDDAFPEFAAACAADVRPIAIDLSDTRLEVPPVDWALLLAARVATHMSRQDPLGDLRAIADVTANALFDLRSERVVHISSGSVYERLDGDLSPTRVPAPRLPYAIGKLTAELLVGSYSPAPYWNLRFFGAFGPGEPTFKITRRLIETFASGERRFSMTGDGTNRIDPMYVSDAVGTIAAFLSLPGESRTIDVCQGEAPSIVEYARLVYEAAHPDPRSAPIDLRFQGEAHERVLGRASPAEQQSLTGQDRLPLSDGLRIYADLLRSGYRSD
jgi:nucleoside-diphosphate-sugar epimerase